MKGISPTFRISFGLVLLTVSAFLFADMLGLVPNRREVLLDARKTLCESLAVQYSSAVATNQYDAIGRSMESVVDRIGDVLSLRMVTADNATIAEAGDHSTWENVSKEKSVANQVVVPIFRGDRRWGSVQIRFDSISGSGPLGLPWGGIVETILFVGISGFFLYWMFIRKTLQHLDPSNVIPSRVKTTLDALAEGVVLMDVHERIVLANATFSRISGEDTDTLLGQRTSEIACLKQESESRLPWHHALEAGKEQKATVVPLSAKNGSIRKYSVNGAPVVDVNGKVRGAMATFDDVTEVEEKNDQLEEMVSLLRRARDEVDQKNKELLATNQIIEAKVEERTVELRKSMEAAKAANRAKSAFIANISHELRTPMHAVLSFAQFGVKKIDKADKAKLLGYFERIHKSGSSLLGLLNNLLDLSKFQANKMTIAWKLANLDDLVEGVVSEFAVLAEGAGTTLQFVASNCDTNGQLDADRITQVIRNLVSNAIKFSQPDTKIQLGLCESTIKISKRQIPALLFWVEDEGVGIPPDQLEAIFDPFTQSRLTDSGSGGTGLGLAICREIVAAHGGRITATNRDTGGARFSFLIPRSQVPELPKTAANAPTATASGADDAIPG